MTLQHIAASLAGLIRRLSDRTSRAEAALFSYEPQWPGCGAELEMKRLIKLSRSTASRETDEIPDGAWRANRCVTASQGRKSYHSRILQKDSRAGDPARAVGDIQDRRNAVAWLIDFAKPANCRVTQVASNGDFDRWATMGDQHYEWLIFQLTQSADPSGPGWRGETNQFLTLDKWLLLLAESQPVRADMYRAYGRRYLLVEYQASSPSGVLIGDWEPEVSRYRETVYAWIDEETDLLVKGVLEATAQMRTGDELHMQLQQVFAGYDHDIGFDPRVPFPELTRGEQK